MHIVQDNHGVVFQQRTGVELLYQRAVSHEHEAGVAVDSGVETYPMGHFPVVAAQLLRHSLGNGNGCDLSRQDYPDLLVADGVPGLYQELRYFCIGYCKRVVFPEPVSAEMRTTSLC
jgi:hypothetical protein